jgi:hypothetical protein
MQFLRSQGQHHGISIKTNQLSCFAQNFHNQQTMSRCSNSSVQDREARGQLQPMQYFPRHHRNMSRSMVRRGHVFAEFLVRKRGSRKGVTRPAANLRFREAQGHPVGRGRKKTTGVSLVCIICRQEQPAEKRVAWYARGSLARRAVPRNSAACFLPTSISVTGSKRLRSYSDRSQDESHPCYRRNPLSPVKRAAVSEAGMISSLWPPISGDSRKSRGFL